MLQAVAGRLGMPAFHVKMVGLLSLFHLLVDIQQGALPALLPVLSEIMALSYAQVGLVMTVYSLTSSFSQPVFGMISDANRYHILIPLGVIVAASGLALFGHAPTYAIILVSAVMMGLGSAAYHPEATRTASDLATSGGRQGAGIALWMFGGNLGVAIGPLYVSAMLVLFGMRGMATLLPVVLVVAIPSLFMFRRMEPGQWSVPSRGAAAEQAAGMPATNWFGEILAISTVMLRTVIHNGILVYLPFYYLDYLGVAGFPTHILQSILLFGGVLGAFAGGVMADRIGVKPVMLAAAIVTMALLPAVLLVTGPILMALLFVLGGALSTSFAMAVILGQRYMPRRASLSAALVNGGGLGLGGALTGVLGVIADTWGIATTMYVILGIPLILVFMAILLPKTKPAESSPA